MTAPILRIEKLSMRFGGITALKEVSLNIPKNQITAIIGPNGAGKTTLFNCLTGFYYPQKGSIYYQPEDTVYSVNRFLGEPLRWQHVLSPKDALSTVYYKMFGGTHVLAQKGIARTFQNIRLFKDMTALENVLVAQHNQANRNLIAGLLNTHGYRNSLKEAIKRSYHYLELFNLAGDANRLAGHLPYGKQRHLEIARALSIQPHLMCLDEPAAGLNPHETDELSSLIKQLKNELHLSILLIEHDMSMVMRLSDSIFVLDHGELISHGTPDFIHRCPKVIEAYLGFEQEKEETLGEPQTTYRIS